jgi:methyl-accepting chemotaxis protein
MNNRSLIYQKIILYQFISLFIITIVFGIFFYKTAYNREMKDLAIQAEQIKKRLSLNLAVFAAASDTANCNSQITQEINNEYVAAIVIIQNGKLLAGKIKSESGNEEIQDITNIEKFQKDISLNYSVQKTDLLYKNSAEEKNVGEITIYFTDKSVKSRLSFILIQAIVQSVFIFLILSILMNIILNNFFKLPLRKIAGNLIKSLNKDIEVQINTDDVPEVGAITDAYRKMNSRLRIKIENLNKIIDSLIEILNKSKEITVDLNTSSLEIEAASMEQTSAISEHASGITEVSATLEELSITAKQITKNVGELVFSSEAVLKLLDESEKQLLLTVSDLDEVGKISAHNSSEIAELGKRSAVINQMVKTIKAIASKTNMLSINASIEASKNKESGAGFSVIASEIRELSLETINSAKNAGNAAREIGTFFNSIITSSEMESEKVINSARVAKSIYNNMEVIVGKVKNNYSFTQKIDVSIKQQENGSRQAADTMKQMAEISRQSAETARETSTAIKNIVNCSNNLDGLIKSFNPDAAGTQDEPVEDKNKNSLYNLNEPSGLIDSIIYRLKKMKLYSDFQTQLQSKTNIADNIIVEKIPAHIAGVLNSIVSIFNLLSSKFFKSKKNVKLT